MTLPVFHINSPCETYALLKFRLQFALNPVQERQISTSRIPVWDCLRCFHLGCSSPSKVLLQLEDDYPDAICCHFVISYILLGILFVTGTIVQIFKEQLQLTLPSSRMTTMCPAHRDRTMDTDALSSNRVARNADSNFTLTRSSDHTRSSSTRRSRSTTPTRLSIGKRRIPRSVSFNLSEVEIRSYDPNIENEGLIWYTIWDFNKIRKENKAAVQNALDACAASGNEVVNEFMKSSLRGLEYCYQGHDGNMALAIKHVVENQQSMSPLILAARYAKLSRPSQMEALQRGREDEKAAKGSNAAPVRPSRQVSRGGDVSPLPPRRKVSDRNDFAPRAPPRKTSSLLSECSARMQEALQQQ
jgi:hypothetical protein